jgi:hypothetical protein
MEDSTAVDKETKNLPPAVITVDTKVKEENVNVDVDTNVDVNANAGPVAEDDEGSHPGRHPTNPETETRTPKHANKSLGTNEEEEDTTPAEGATNDKDGGTTTPSNTPNTEGEALTKQAEGGQKGSQPFFAPRPYDGNIGAPTGAFQPHERLQQQHNQLMTMQGSPGAGRYYGNYPHGHHQYPPGYDQRGPHEYAHGLPPSQYGGQPMYPPQQYHGAYQQRQGPPPPGWGPHVSYHGRLPPNYSAPHPGMVQSYHAGTVTSSNTFSRAVSSSFDRSVKSSMPPPVPAQDERSMSDDGSWRQLNQIQSVDEEEIRKRLASKQMTPKNQGETDAEQPASTSSSLTNSPTEEVEATAAKKDVLPGPPKMTNSLDSLSSVASAQAPLAVKKEESTKKQKPLSPSDSAEASLDLMKCESGSSNLLLPSHQRNLSQFSFEGSGNKRQIDEQREGVDDTKAKDAEKMVQTEQPPPKRSRVAQDANDKKGSPLSITCSPTNAHTKDNEKAYSYAPTSKDSFLDKPPMFSYSIDSAPAMPREENRGGTDGEPTYPGLPLRGHPSATSPPMPPLDEAVNDPPALTQIQSWEIHGQDSFGATSATNPLAGTFSFAQDYPMLSRNDSMMSHPMDATMPPKHHGMVGLPPIHPGSHQMHERHLESRNQSFEGGHYHGSFSRADSMSFESRAKGVPDARQGYHQPHYPPHAPSWGSQGSYPPPPPPHLHYPHSPHYRMHVHPGMMRTFSHESTHGMHPNFQPPSEFQAPPTNLNKNRPRTEKHILTSPFVASKSGVFGWTKEEDMRLTEIMKKHKNPRDWEPIAKELGRNRK